MIEVQGECGQVVKSGGWFRRSTPQEVFRMTVMIFLLSALLYSSQIDLKWISFLLFATFPTERQWPGFISAHMWHHFFMVAQTPPADLSGTPPACSMLAPPPCVSAVNHVQYVIWGTFRYTVWEPCLKDCTSHTYDLLSASEVAITHGSLSAQLSWRWSTKSFHCPSDVRCHFNGCPSMNLTGSPLKEIECHT